MLMTVHGEADIIMTIGTAKIVHRVLLADIEENVILGMNIMNTHTLVWIYNNIPSNTISYSCHITNPNNFDR